VRFSRAVAPILSVVALCSAHAAGPVSELDILRGPARADPADGFVRALQPREFEFPADHGPHPSFRHEWWYVTGNLDSAHGQRFGFELTFFRIALVPPGSAAAGVSNGASRWRAGQVYLAHFAITDVDRGVFRFAQKYSRDALGLAGAEADPFHVWIDNWTLGWPSLHAQGSGYDLRLDLQPLSAPVLNGEHGLSRKAAEPGAASYYYSLPRIAVRGRILREGEPVEVHGLAWLDREWGSGSLGTNQQGWDWFALQLQDGSTLMFYSLRVVGGGQDPNSAGTWVDATGRARPLSSADVHIEVQDHWTSPCGGHYPSRWHLLAPTIGLDVQVRPILANQELGTMPRYWEGAVDVSGTQGGSRSISGRGYVELVGYAH
jgi:predicted secreted hydrolase